MSELPAEPNPKKRAMRLRGANTPPADDLPSLSASPEYLETTAPSTPVAASEPAAGEPPAAPPTSASTATGPAAGNNRNDTSKATPEPAANTFIRSAKRPLLQAAALLLAAGAGWLGAQAVSAARSDAQASVAPWAETAQSLRQGQQDVLRLNGDIKSLTAAMTSLKDSVDRSKADLIARQGQLAERVEAAAKDPAARLAGLNERFDRMERQMTALQTAVAAKPPAPPPEPVAQTASLDTKPAVKDALKDVPVEGWVLHEVYDGVALVEGRNRRLFEVGPGGIIPGVGPVVAIERRGKRWVVVTPRGFIGMDR